MTRLPLLPIALVCVACAPRPHTGGQRAHDNLEVQVLVEPGTDTDDVETEVRIGDHPVSVLGKKPRRVYARLPQGPQRVAVSAAVSEWGVRPATVLAERWDGVGGSRRFLRRTEWVESPRELLSCRSEARIEARPGERYVLQYTLRSDGTCAHMCRVGGPEGTPIDC